MPAKAKILLTYGGGSIKRNGIISQVALALKNWQVIEFGGIEPNPRYETCMKAVELVRAEGIDFLLAVGGGSVLDGTKFIAAAVPYKGSDPWDMLTDWELVPANPLPIGCVMTLPATGSEATAGRSLRGNRRRTSCFSSRRRTYPRFSILDPETTYTLPPRQTANGVVDAFVHTIEQYLTYPADAPLQDRQAEAILLTLIEEGPKALADPRNYAVRANLMWCATQALNGLIACGVPQDWTTHMIGHEFTALYGIDHAQSLALVLPGILQHERGRKQAKLLQYAARVWGIRDGDDDARATQAIEKTEQFFRSLGVGTRFSDYNIPHEAIESGRRSHRQTRHEARRAWRFGRERSERDFGVESVVVTRIAKPQAVFLNP